MIAPDPIAFSNLRSHLQTLVERSKVPGIQYVVVDGSHTVFEFNGGWADLGGRARVNESTTMMAYSMSKTITAVAALQLVETGKISLDESLDKHIDFCPYGAGITIRHLLSHTSGIPNPIPLRWVHLGSEHASFDEAAALAEVLKKSPRLSFPPGSKYAYSNIGYWLLGQVIEKASGQPFTSYVIENVLKKLGLTSQELDYTISDLAHHACGYLEKYSFMNLAKRLLIDGELIGDYQGRWLRINNHYPNGPAFGGLVGSARGFATILQDQLRDHSVLLKNSTRALLYEQQHTTKGTPVAITLGWHIGNLKGTTFYFKEGGGGGFHSMMRLYPSAGIGTVLMTNATGFNVNTLLDTLDAQYLHSA